MLLLVENNRTQSGTKYFNKSVNNSAELLPNGQGSLQTNQEETKGLPENSLTKTLRNVKRKCPNHEAKLDSSSQSILNLTETETNLSKDNSSGVTGTSQSRCSSPER